MSNVESILTSLRRELQSVKGRWVDVAKRSGVPYHTLTKVAQGRVDPRLSTVQRLVDHFGVAKNVLPDKDAGVSA